MVRLRFYAAALVVIGMLSPCGAEEKSAPHDTTWIDQRVRDYQPTAAEKRIDEIGWARDIREAERLAKEHRRPVMLFTHDGRINIGRC